MGKVVVEDEIKVNEKLYITDCVMVVVVAMEEGGGVHNLNYAEVKN